MPKPDDANADRDNAGRRDDDDAGREETGREETGGRERLYTRDELERAISDRVRRERERYADYDDKAKRSDELDGVVSERDELAKRIEALEAETTRVQLHAAVQAEAVRQGARHPDDVFRLLDTDAISIEDGKPRGVAAAVRKLADAKPAYFAGGDRGDGGARERSAPPKTPDMNDLLRSAAAARQ